MFHALRQPGPVRSVLTAWLLAAMGGWTITIALAVFAFGRSGTTAVGVVTAARLLPAMCAAPLTGSLVDRGDRGRIVAVACVVEAACLAAVAALVIAGAALVLIVVLAAAGSVAATATRPGLQALLPALAATPEQLTGATAAWGAVDNMAFLLGAGVGGAAIAGVGAGAVAACAAGMVAVAAALAAGLPSVTAAPDDSAEVREGVLAVLAGIRAVVDTRMLHVPFALFTGLLLLEGTSDVQLVSLALGKLHMGTGGPGVLYGVWGVGGILGSAAIMLLTRRRGYGLCLAVGALTFAVGLVVAGADGTVVAVAAMVPAGLGFALVETAVMALVPRLADDAVIGRVYALSEVIYAGAAAVGALLAPPLVSAFGAGGSLVAVGVAFALLAVLAAPSYRRLDAGQDEAGRVRTLLRGVRFLEPLPLPQLERLVRAARPMTVRAGTTVLRAGDHGDDFFVIEHGTVEVAPFGRYQGPGTGFGEIALLRDVPRTATINAATDLSLWSIGRQSFLAAVSGHGDARRLADAVVAEHLGRGHPSPSHHDPPGA